MPLFQNYQIPPPQNWEDFEQLCCDLWRAIWNDPGTLRNGRRGQPQHGVDIYGQPDDNKHWAGVQCKGKEYLLHSKLTKKELVKEVEKAKKFRPRLSEFILATTGPKDAAIEELARKISDEHEKQGVFRVSVFSWRDIQDRLADHPEIAKKHYPQFFPKFTPNLEAVHRAYLENIRVNPLFPYKRTLPICEYFIEPKLILRNSPQNESHEADEVTLDWLLFETSEDVVIKAPCGFGKTTLLEYITHRMGVDSKKYAKCVPIYCHFRFCSSWRTWSNVVEYIATWLKLPPDNIAPWLEREEQKLLFLLDGLDQISLEEKPRRALEMLNSREVRLFVAGRPEAFESFSKHFSKYLTVEIMSFDRDRAKRYCKKAGINDHKEAYEIVKQDWDAPDGPKLFDSPLMLNYLRQLVQDKKKIEKGLTRATLYEQILEYYYEWEDPEAIMGKFEVSIQPSFKEIREVWKDVAFEAFAFDPIQIQHMEPKFIEHARISLTKNGKDEKLFNIAMAWGIFDHYRNRNSQNCISFLHQNFQEYLAACKLKDMFQKIVNNKTGSYADSLDYYGHIGKIKISEEIGSIIAELLAAEHEHLVCELQRWIEDDDNLGDKSGDDEDTLQTKWNILLFAVMVRDLLMEKCKDCRVYVQACFDKETSLLQEEDENDYWITILEGYFIRGDWRRQNSTPIRKVYLSKFLIGKNLVTCREFSKFRHDRKTALFLQEKPIVYVSWLEAISYCIWQAEKSMENVMLPTEAQWEKAARGRLGRIFPWGNEWSQHKCHTMESFSWGPIDVSTYEEGRSPYGCYDMAGNAREWCLDGYVEDSYRDTKCLVDPQGPVPWEKCDDPSRKCFLPNLRGGSWFNEKTTARCGNRFWYYPLFKDPDQGFRCVIVPGKSGKQKVEQISQWCRVEDEAIRHLKNLYPRLSKVKPDKKKTLVEQMNEVLGPVREFCISDGGNVQVMEVKENTAYLELKGACPDCQMRNFTKKRAEQDLKRCFGGVSIQWRTPRTL